MSSHSTLDSLYRIYHFQAYLDMNRTDEAKTYFVNALKRLGRQQPKTATGVMKRTFSAYMTQLLHRKMPNVFVDRSE